ncbi:MAG: hypothetical protein NVSMB49_16810 [Ktedonobacteraceae bacterium]
MPKKATPARSGVQRTRPKVQKSFELVRPIPEVQERETEETVTTKDVATETGSTTSASSEISSELEALPTVPKKKARSSSVVTEVAPTEPVVAKPTADEVEVPAGAAKGSASARLAARKNMQRSQQRSSASLITADHYSYVRRDLVFIAILAAIMFIAIIVLYFVLPGVGA